MDDRGKAVSILAVAVVIGVGGVLAAQGLIVSRSGAVPPASLSPAEVADATLPLPTSTAQPTAGGSPSALPTRAPTTKPTPAPPWKPAWSKPRLVDKEVCGEFAVGIDPSSRYHVVSLCGLRYSSTNADGDWATTSLGDSKAQGPLIAFDGNHEYIAYWRVLPYEPDTCGGFQWPPSAGVYFRKRTLPDGKWSNAIPFGRRGDHLTAFRVRDGVLHAIVWNETRGGTSYLRSTQDPVETARYRIQGDEWASLRVGDEGRARIAFWNDHGSLVYGTFNGSGFATAKIASGPTDGAPMLVLAPGDVPHVAYTIVPPIQGCGDGEQLSRAGTYYATMVNGRWTSQRITKKLGLSSLGLDPGTGRIHVLVGDTLLTKQPNRPWASARLPKGVERPVMRVDPATGRVLVVYQPLTPDGDFEGLFAITSG